jgi:hypothetical protein
LKTCGHEKPAATLKWGQVFNLPIRKPGVPAAPGGMPAATSKREVQGGNPQGENLRPLSGRRHPQVENLRPRKTCGHEKPAATKNLRPR